MNWNSRLRPETDVLQPAGGSGKLRVALGLSLALLHHPTWSTLLTLLASSSLQIGSKCLERKRGVFAQNARFAIGFAKRAKASLGS